MFELLSHVLAFGVLSAAAVYDLRTTEVPDPLSIAGVAGGIILHLGASIHTGSWEPLKWSLAVGALYSVYGWGMYYGGMWGGADAFAVSVLGFAAPYPVSGFELAYPANLFINFMLVGFLYTLGFAVYHGLGEPSVRNDFTRRMREERLRLALEMVGVAAISVVSHLYLGLNGAVYFVALAAMVVLMRFLQAVEDEAMVETVPVSEVEEGAVVSEVGNRIRGASENEIKELEEEEVRVKSGVKFVPVFPVALLITDLAGGGLQLLGFLVLS